MRNITSKRDSIFQLENLQSMPVKTEKKRFKCSVCDKSFILRKKKVPILDPFMRENSQTQETSKRIMRVPKILFTIFSETALIGNIQKYEQGKIDLQFFDMRY